MIDNPAWIDLQRQVADLEGRRDQLLVDRTPEHPAVQEIEGRLAEVKEQLAATPRQIPDSRANNLVAAETPGASSAAADDLATKEQNQKLGKKLGELTAALKKSRLACHEAELAEKKAGQQLAAAPQFIVQYADAVQDPQEVDYGWRRLLWTTFASSILMVFGIAAVAFGASIEPAVASVDEVEAILGEPVLGVIPDDGPAPDVAAIQRQSQMRRAAIACGVLLILACPVVAIWGVTGI
jgi:hypothetical protein